MRSPVAVAAEAVLFVAEKPVSLRELAKIIGVSAKAAEAGLIELDAHYEATGLRMQHDDEGNWQIVTAPSAASYVAAYLGADRLRVSPAGLETLAVIAYRQPVTRAEVEAIRGVNCEQAIYTLMSRRLIDERGRRETPGRPIEYETTWEFLECFGLTSLEELPRVLTPEGLIEQLPADAADAAEVVNRETQEVLEGRTSHGSAGASESPKAARLPASMEQK